VAYDVEHWSDFFVGAAGASAALTGLVFVAVSINLEAILAYEGLPERAFETVVMLLSVVVVSLVGLVPGQSTTALGAEILGVMAAFDLGLVILLRRSLPALQRRRWIVSRIAVTIPGVLAMTIGGASVLATSGGGLYWVFAGSVLALCAGVLNAWVLLIEIRR
jgi:modulator of FtsH protease